MIPPRLAFGAFQRRAPGQLVDNVVQALVLNITPASWLRTKLLAAVVGKRAYWSGLSSLHLRRLQPPTLPGPGWVICQTRLGGLCGSDLATVLLRQAPNSILQGVCSMPMIPGHENVARVAEVHPSVDAAWVGKRVCVEPTLCCAARGIDPPCRRCTAGEFGVCENFASAGEGEHRLPSGVSIGYNRRTGGSWGEYFVAHVSQLIAVPDHLTDEQAILTDPLACSLHGVLRTNLDGVDAICVYGGGILGLGVVAGLRAVGYTGRIDSFARHAFQRELAVSLGADNALPAGDADKLDTMAKRVGGRVVRVRLGGRMLTGGYDVVYECVGSPQCVNNALKLTRNRGQVMLVGTSGHQRVDMTAVWLGELSVVGAYGRQVESWRGRPIGTYQLVHELLLTGRSEVGKLLTHSFPLPDFRRAFDVATHKGATECVKVALRCG